MRSQSAVALLVPLREQLRKRSYGPTEVAEIEVTLQGGSLELGVPVLSKSAFQSLPIDSRLLMVASNGNPLAPQVALDLRLRLPKKFRDISNTNETARHDCKVSSASLSSRSGNSAASFARRRFLHTKSALDSLRFAICCKSPGR